MLYKHASILESCRDNNGERTVLRVVLEPYATDLPHAHSLFTESFYVEEGTLDLWNGFGKVHLELAQSMSIGPNTLHHFVAGKQGCTVTITLQPGNLNFEYAMQIIRGLENNDAYSSVGSIHDNNLALLAILCDLTDASPASETKERIEALLNSAEAENVKVLKKTLLTPYGF